MANYTSWKADLHKLVGKSFKFNYDKKSAIDLMRLIGEETTSSAQFELVGDGGYGEMRAYDGDSLNFGAEKRGFRTIVEPHEYSMSEVITRKQAKTDMYGNCDKVGKKLGDSAAITPYMHILRMFGGAFDAVKTGDGEFWASAAHAVASKADSTTRERVKDTAAGEYSNLITDQLTIGAIKKARGMAKRYTTPDGLPLVGKWQVLLVSPELEGKAIELLGNYASAKPSKNPDGTANNQANPIADMYYVVCGGGKDGFKEKQWAIADEDLLKETAKLIWTTKPEVLENDLDNPLKAQFTGYADFATGVADARGIIFSNGTANA